ncbi:MAG: beta-ketoacyl-[acyl-carrier-protein] synthase family protein, partial [Acidobacteriota bacterium]
MIDTPASPDADQSPRVVVTGVGAVSAWGWTAEALRRGLATGDAAIGRPTHFATAEHRTHLAAEVPEPPGELADSVTTWSRLSVADRFAVVAADEAIAAAGVDPERFDAGERAGCGVFFGGSTAAMAEGEGFYHRLHGPGHAHARVLASHPLNGPGDAVARHIGAAGPVSTLSSACASGALAIGAALDALRDGEVDLAVAGGSDSLCHLTFGGFNALRIVDPEHCSPFRARRQGLNLGEGAGVLVLETAEHARARGARVLAEVIGHGASCDAHHMTAPHPEGAGAAAALNAALDDAVLGADAVDWINAHGTGTPHNDAAEWRALATVFGDRASDLPVTSTKGAVGHLLGSSGAIEAVATVQCLDARSIHVTANAEAGAP